MTKQGTHLFHITAIPNLPNILSCGALLAKRRLAAMGAGYADIAYQNIQGRRAMKQVPRGPGGVIHDYVPFYFAPRSPMLRTIDGGNVPGCDYRQSDIVHLKTSINSVVQSGLPYVFYNYNAATSYAQCFDDVKELGNVDWDLFFEQPVLDGYCRYWNSIHSNPRYVRRMETRMAEFLVYDACPIDLIEEIGVRTENIAANVREILRAHNCNIPVYARPAWYY